MFGLLQAGSDRIERSVEACTNEIHGHYDGNRDAAGPQVCEDLKNNVVFIVEHLPSGASTDVTGGDLGVEAVPSAPKPRCLFFVTLNRTPGPYRFTANVSATPVSAQGWQTTCDFTLNHPDLMHPPGSPLFGFMHWVHFFQDQTGADPTISSTCCTAQQHEDNQPNPPNFPEGSC
jgi:hypothetical protein